jgi:Ca2+/Na+ antiporter
MLLSLVAFLALFFAMKDISVWVWVVFAVVLVLYIMKRRARRAKNE